MARLRLDHAQATVLPIAPRGFAPDPMMSAARAARVPFGGQYLARSAGLITEIYEPGLVVPAPFSVQDLETLGTIGTDASPNVTLAMAAPIAAGGTLPLGRFLTEGLAIALLQRDGLGAVPLVGAEPTPVQRAALEALELARGYTVIEQPTRVRRMVVTRREPEGVGVRAKPAHADRFMRVAIEALRFAVEPFEISAQVALRRRVPPADFVVANRLSFDRWLASMGVASLDAEAMQIGDKALGLFDLAAALAGARAVVIDDPAQAGLLGFCDPGTQIIEVAIEGWTDPRIAAMCRIFALDWQVVLCAAPAYSLSQPVPLGSASLLRTEIDIAGVAVALGVA